MKKVILSLLFIFSICCAYAQNGNSLDQAQVRLENAFNQGNLNAVEDMFSNSFALRLEDKLYLAISPILAMENIQKFLKDKKVLSFKIFKNTNSGTLVYEQDGKQKKLPVDLKLSKSGDDYILYALNISNHPSVTAFENVKSKK